MPKQTNTHYQLCIVTFIYSSQQSNSISSTTATIEYWHYIVIIMSCLLQEQ